MAKDLIERFPTAESAPAGPRHARHEVLMRRAGILVLVAVVAVGCLGLLGPTSRTVAETTPAGAITLRYDALTRPGVDNEVRLSLRPERSVDSLTVAIDQAALETYGVEGFSPEPTEQRAQGDDVIMEFAVADGDDFEIRIAGRTPTTQSPGRTTWRVRWLVDGAPAATLEASTWVVP